MTAAFSSPVRPKSQKVPAAVPSQPQRHRVMMELSEHETTDPAGDSEWASDNSTSESEREQEVRAQRVDWLQQAVQEAQRQWDMFAKVPRWSYANLPRTKSGLLSQLLHPDPKVFPPGHSYHCSISSQDMMPFGQESRGAFTPLSKSSVALPHATTVVVHASSVKAKDSLHVKKGRTELEEDLESEGKNTYNRIQVSQSLAQQKLATLADARRRRHTDRGPVPSEPPVCPQFPSIATAPIPLVHPYNLPAPALPTTPRTTRRQMLSTELSESLRRNLLWERQVSWNTTMGRRWNGSIGNGTRPLTAVHDGARNIGSSGSKNGNEGMGERRQHVVRNHSWADDYHYAGW